MDDHLEAMARAYEEQDEKPRLTPHEMARRILAVEEHLASETHRINRRIDFLMSATQGDINQMASELTQVATDLGTTHQTLQNELNALASTNPSIDLTGLRSAVSALEPAVSRLNTLSPQAPANAAQEPLAPTTDTGQAVTESTTPGDQTGAAPTGVPVAPVTPVTTPAATPTPDQAAGPAVTNPPAPTEPTGPQPGTPGTV